MSKPLRLELRHHGAGELGGLVGAVVEHLDVQLVARPVERGRRFDATPQYAALVEGRDLHHDVRQIGVVRQRRGQQLLLAAQPPLLQAMMQDHHVEQAADEGGQQDAAHREDRGQQQGQGGDDGHHVPALGVRLNSVLRPNTAPTIGPALAAAR